MISNELLKRRILDMAIRGKLVENDLSLKPVDADQIVEDVPFAIPNNWKWIELEQCVDFNVGKTPPTKDSSYWGEDVKWVSISDMKHRKFVDSTSRSISNKAYLQTFNRKIVPIGTLLMSFKLTIGRLSITNIECVHNEAIVSLYPKDYLLRDYLLNALDGLDLEKNVKNAIKGKILNSKSIAKITIPIPPIEEQHRIVVKIEELFNLIDKKDKNDQEKSNLKDILKKKILDSAIHGNLIENDLSLVPIDVEQTTEVKPFEIPSNWKWCCFKQLFEIVNGFTPLRTNKDFWENGTIPWFTVDDIKRQGHIINETIQYITSKAIGSNSKRLLPKNTILLCCTSATIGNFALTNIELTTNQQWNGLVLKHNIKRYIFPKYIFYYVQTLKNKMLVDGNSTTFPFISLKRLEKYLIPVPPLEEQQKLVSKIEQCLDLIEQL